jgi:exopolysaccharide biosynthesis polyprenyl glycosylphosphotransferase
MAPRLSWLGKRKALVGLALIDCGVLLAMYNLLFRHQFGRWPGMSGAVLALMMSWITFSYLLGRYSNTTDKKSAASLAIVVLIVTALTVAAAWLGNKGDTRTLPQFLLPLLTCSGVVSTIVAKGIDRQTRKTERWLIVARKEEQLIVAKELERSFCPQLSINMCSEENETEEELRTCSEKSGIAISEHINLSDKSVEELLDRRSKGQEVIRLTDWIERELQLMPPELLTREWLVMADGFRIQAGQFSWRLKRLGDISLGGFLLLISSPLIIASAILIKLEDGGPILYSQIRSGLYEKQFRIWKLRSMKTSAEKDEAKWASANDTRVTHIGRLVRKMRIDELPQLINVLAGEMSLIGPRPERPEIEQTLNLEIRNYKVRHWARPGLSGWAQVNYCYGASIQDSRIKLSYDLYYLRNFSIWLDILILVKTIRLIIRGEGSTPIK